MKGKAVVVEVADDLSRVTGCVDSKVVTKKKNKKKTLLRATALHIRSRNAARSWSHN